MPPPKQAYIPNVLNLIGMIIALAAGIYAVTWELTLGPFFPGGPVYNFVPLRADSPWPFAIALICLLGAIRLPSAPPPKKVIPAIIMGIKMGVIPKILFVLAGAFTGTYLFYFMEGTKDVFESTTVPWFGVVLPLIPSLIADFASIKALRAIEKTIPY